MYDSIFFSEIRKDLFRGKLKQSQVDGVNAIINGWIALAKSPGNVRQLAYVLATACHETGYRMQPVREAFAQTDEEARQKLAKYRYAKADPETDHAYYGRGLVQITWKENYQRLGKIIGADLVHKPDLALIPEHSVHILIKGMDDGLFTGRKLSQYFPYVGQGIADPVNARRIINGTDKAEHIAGQYRAFLDALVKAGYGKEQTKQGVTS